MTKKSVITFKLSELNSFLADPKSCVTCVRQKQHLSIFPWCLANLKKSVENILNSKTSLYHKNLGGILLGARNISLLSSLGALRHDSPEIHIDIEADFYIFKPEIGSVLDGTIIKKSDHFVGCLVHRIFNISIPRNNDNWPGKYLEIGNNVTFKIIFMDLAGRLPYIRGEIDPSMEFEDMNENEEHKPELHVHLQKSKKVKKTYFENMEVDVKDEHDEADSVPQIEKKQKKSKKHKERYMEVEQIDIKEELPDVIENCMDDSPVKRSKKKNKKKEQEKQAVLEDYSDENDIPKAIKTNENNYKIKSEDLNESNKNIDVKYEKIHKNKESRKSKKNHTDNEEYTFGDIHDVSKSKNSKSNAISFNQDSNKSTDESKRNSLVSNLLNMVQNSLSPTKKLKHKNQESNESFKNNGKSRKRKHSLESTQKIKIEK